MSKFKPSDRCVANRQALPLLIGKVGTVTRGPWDECPIPMSPLHTFFRVKGEWYEVSFDDKSITPDGTSWYCIAECLDPIKPDRNPGSWDDIESITGWNPQRETVH